MLATLSRALEARDPYLQGHSERVTAVAEAVALRLGWSGERLSTLQLGGRLHDIGKVAVPASVLRKPAPLDDHEREQIRLHPRFGARLVERVEAARPALPYVLYHHERWDGTGYPSGKRGEEIPVEARVLAIADAFDAMTSDRPYRNALSREEALAEVERCAGTQFDPKIARVFLEVFGHDTAGDVRAAAAS
jgi:HD-GYP domain-containing protein (c-di-GMP phosphodiesterase class II)